MSVILKIFFLYMGSQLRNCRMSQEETLNSVANGYDYSPDTSECVVR